MIYFFCIPTSFVISINEHFSRYYTSCNMHLKYIFSAIFVFFPRTSVLSKNVTPFSFSSFRYKNGGVRFVFFISLHSCQKYATPVSHCSFRYKNGETELIVFQVGNGKNTDHSGYNSNFPKYIQKFFFLHLLSYMNMKKIYFRLILLFYTYIFMQFVTE